MRSKCFAFRCGGDSKNKLKGTSQSYSKNVKHEEYKKCLDGDEYQKECDNCIIRSLNQEMYPPQVKKNQRYLFSMMNDLL